MLALGGGLCLFDTNTQRCCCRASTCLWLSQTVLELCAHVCVFVHECTEFFGSALNSTIMPNPLTGDVAQLAYSMLRADVTTWLKSVPVRSSSTLGLVPS